MRPPQETNEGANGKLDEGSGTPKTKFDEGQEALLAREEGARRRPTRGSTKAEGGTKAGDGSTALAGVCAPSPPTRYPARFGRLALTNFTM